MSKKIVFPKMRFQKFHDLPAWEIRNFGSLAVPVSDRAGTNKYLLMSVTSGEGLIPQIEKFGREIAGNAYRDYYVIRKNDFAYNKSATKQFPEGYIAMLAEYDEAALPNSIFTCFRIVNGNCVPKFFDCLFHNNYHGRWLRKYIQVGARAHGSLKVDAKHLWDMPVALPQIEEQQKIADCLSSLDDLILAEKQKLENLEEYRKGMLQKLFPAEGKTLPEWRFPEFRTNDDWKTKKLGDFTNVLMCKRIHANETCNNGDVPFYKIGTLGGQPDAFISRELFSQYKTKYSYPRTGEVLLTCSGTVGKCFPYDGEDAYYQDSNIVWIDNPTLEISNELLLNLLRNINWTKLNSTTITRIYGNDLRNLIIKFPQDIKEQQKISDCLSSIDDIITGQAQKIDALITYKKGLMQGLFPSIEEVENEQ